MEKPQVKVYDEKRIEIDEEKFLKVSVISYPNSDGKKVLDIRRWFFNKKGEERPTKLGVQVEEKLVQELTNQIEMLKW